MLSTTYAPTNDALSPEIMANISSNEGGEISESFVHPCLRHKAGRDEKNRKEKKPAIDAFDTIRITSLPNPLPGSIMDTIQKASNRRVLVDALFWVPYHLIMLRVQVCISVTLDQQQLLLPCADLGKVPRDKLALSCIIHIVAKEMRT